MIAWHVKSHGRFLSSKTAGNKPYRLKYIYFCDYNDDDDDYDNNNQARRRWRVEKIHLNGKWCDLMCVRVRIGRWLHVACFFSLFFSDDTTKSLYVTTFSMMHSLSTYTHVGTCNRFSLTVSLIISPKKYGCVVASFNLICIKTHLPLPR